GDESAFTERNLDDLGLGRPLFVSALCGNFELLHGAPFQMCSAYHLGYTFPDVWKSADRNAAVTDRDLGASAVQPGVWLLPADTLADKLAVAIPRRDDQRPLDLRVDPAGSTPVNPVGMLGAVADVVRLHVLVADAGSVHVVAVPQL